MKQIPPNVKELARRISRRRHGENTLKALCDLLQDRLLKKEVGVSHDLRTA